MARRYSGGSFDHPAVTFLLCLLLFGPCSLKAYREAWHEPVAVGAPGDD